MSSNTKIITGGTGFESHCRAKYMLYQNAAAETTYNISCHNEWPNLNLIKLLCKVIDDRLGRPPGISEILITFMTDTTGHDLRYAIDADKLQHDHDLGWKTSLRLEKCLENTVDRHLANKA